MAQLPRAAERSATASRWRIPFNRPPFLGTEIDHLRKVLESGRQAGDGPYSARCTDLLRDLVGSPRAFLTPSCTHALELAAILVGIEPGDEVILPSFTFPSTANAFVLRGARPVFADVRPDTLNVDETRLAALVTPRTKAICVVHYAGVGCEMDAILDLASGRGLVVIEDNAQGLFGSYRGRPLGSFGALAALSFHETKNVSCGEGGALLVNDPAYVDRAEIVREKGTDRARFARRQVERYTWVDLGSSYLPSELQAAVLFAQLEARERIQARRRAIWERYASELARWAAASEAGLPTVPAHAEQSYHLFYVLAPTPEDRDRLIAHLSARRILAPFHYVPLHLSRMGRAFGGKPGDLPVTESVSARLVRLPLYFDLTDDDQGEVIDAVRSFAV